MSRNERLRLSAAVEKLLDTSKLITLREGVRKSEARRVQDGLELIERPEIEATDRTSTRRMQYQRFLKKVKEVGGPQMVVLCTACLGQSSLALMRERDRLLLPAELKRHSSTYQSDLFSYLAKTYSNDVASQTQAHSLRGDVYQLTIEDVQNVLMIRDVRGTILLTNTYNAETSPFITVPISREMSEHFAARCQHLM